MTSLMILEGWANIRSDFCTSCQVSPMTLLPSLTRVLQGPCFSSCPSPCYIRSSCSTHPSLSVYTRTGSPWRRSASTTYPSGRYSSWNLQRKIHVRLCYIQYQVHCFNKIQTYRHIHCFHFILTFYPLTNTLLHLPRSCLSHKRCHQPPTPWHPRSVTTTTTHRKWLEHINTQGNQILYYIARLNTLEIITRG